MYKNVFCYIEGCVTVFILHSDFLQGGCRHHFNVKFSGKDDKKLFEHDKTKKLFEHDAVKKFTNVCVYGEKGTTVEEALKRDGRFRVRP